MAQLLHHHMDGIQVPDEELLRRVSAGDESYLEEIFRRHAANLKRHAASVVGSGEAADDVVQDAFAKTMLRIRDGAAIADIRAWLHTCVHNVALNHVKYQRYRVHADLDGDLDAAPGPSTHDQVHLKESTTAVLEALSRLPKPQRSVFVLTEVRGFNYDEAASQLGMTVDSVRQRLHRARRELRRALGPEVASAAAPLLRKYWGIHSSADDRASIRERLAQLISQFGSSVGSQLGERLGTLLPAAASALALTAAVIVATNVGGVDSNNRSVRSAAAGTAPAPGNGAQVTLPGGGFLGVPIAILPAGTQLDPTSISSGSRDRSQAAGGVRIASRRVFGDLASSVALTLGDLADSLRGTFGEGERRTNIRDALADAWRRFVARLEQAAGRAQAVAADADRRSSGHARAGSSSGMDGNYGDAKGSRNAIGLSGILAGRGSDRSSASGPSSNSGTGGRQPSRSQSPKRSKSPQPGSSSPSDQTTPQTQPNPSGSRPGGGDGVDRPGPIGDGVDRPGVVSPGDGSSGDGIGGDRPGPVRR